MRARVIARAAGAAGALAITATGCGSAGSSSTGAAAPVPSPTASASTRPLVTAPTPPSSGSTQPTPTALGTTLDAKQVADPGLASHIGSGKLSAAQAKRLLQYFEDRVSRAYATGDANALYHYLAGPMLSGNRATIDLLNSKHRHNVFKIRVQSVKFDANTAHRVILEMTGDMTVDYFYDTRTHHLVDNGLPGPSQVQFIVFLDQNPKTGTWYWTGEQSNTNGGDSSSGISGGGSTG